MASKVDAIASVVEVIQADDKSRAAQAAAGGAVHVESSWPAARKRLVSTLEPIKWKLGFKVFFSRIQLVPLHPASIVHVRVEQTAAAIQQLHQAVGNSLKVGRYTSWHSLLFWVLDIAYVNAYTI
jgi:hypothetical protein